jgi:hypothetical protein
LFLFLLKIIQLLKTYRRGMNNLFLSFTRKLKYFIYNGNNSLHLYTFVP